MVKLKKLTHIAFAVKSIDQALPIFQELFGATVLFGPFIPSDRQHRTVFISFGGIVSELMEPINDQGFLARCINKKGEGLNHISFDVDNISAATKDLKSNGIRIFREKLDCPGLKYSFIHPKSFFGIELHLDEGWKSFNDLETL